jgi:hypothetical protein
MQYAIPLVATAALVISAAMAFVFVASAVLFVCALAVLRAENARAANPHDRTRKWSRGPGPVAQPLSA